MLGLDKISAVVRTNSATAEESTAASEELSGQAHKMKELVSKFKLRNEADQDQDIQTERIQEESENII